MPASVEKLYTSAAALRRLGAAARLTHEVLADDAARRRRASSTATSTCAAAATRRSTSIDLGALAAAGRRRRASPAITGRVIGDESPSTAGAASPSSGYGSPATSAPLCALIVNRGRTGKRAALLAGRPGALRGRRRSPRQLRQPASTCPPPSRRGRTPEDAGRVGRVALADRGRADPADEPAVGQLHGRDAAQGARRRRRRAGHAPRRAPPWSRRRCRGVRRRARGRRRLRASRAATARRRARS